MKKIFALFLAFFLTFTLVACSTPEQKTETDSSSSTNSVIENTTTSENNTTEEKEPTITDVPETSQNQQSSSSVSSDKTSSNTQNSNTSHSNQNPQNNQSTSNTTTSTKPGVVIDVTNNKDDKDSDKTVIDVSRPVVPITPPTATKPDNDKPATSENGNQTTEKDNIIVEEIPDGGKVEQPDTPEIKEEVQVVTSHTALASNYYYQYSTLSSSEKEVYNMITDAIQNTNNVVDVSSKSLKYNTALALMQKYFSDNPQYFYVSKGTSLTYDPNTNKVYSLILYYTDGATTDRFNSDGTALSVTADRNKISQQISSFNKKIADILKQIPVNATTIEKEKIIHDYIINNVEYDKSVLNQSYGFGDTLPHAFTVYGAVCNGKAVCEGYSKMFQYLCYNVGINATQVVGTSMNVNHMWNTVRIDNAWYQIDTTWDDTCSDDLVYYGYFNVTTNSIQEDHIINSSVINVPRCATTTHAFMNDFSLNVTDTKQIPTNIDKVCNYIQNNISEEYLLIYIGSNNVTQNYLKEHIFNQECAFQKAISSKGYTFSVELKYRVLGSYIYIPIER